MFSNTNYVVTIQRPTAVFSANKISIGKSKEEFLVLGKNSFFQIFSVNDDALKLLKNVKIYGRIQILQKFRTTRSDEDFLFLLNEKNVAFFFKIDENLQIVTLFSGSFNDSSMAKSARPVLCAIDEEHDLILLHTTDGMIKLIQTGDLVSRKVETFNVQIGENHLIDVKFIAGFDRATFAVLSSKNSDDEEKSCFLRCYQIENNEFKLKLLPWREKIDFPSAKFVVPLGRNEFRFLLFASNQIGLFSDKEKPIFVKSSFLEEFKSIGAVSPTDENQQTFLLSANGKLFRLTMENFSFDFLGEISMAESIVPLENKSIFLGSRFGDSFLVRLENSSSIEFIETLPNSGPILDMSIVGSERENRQLVSCSGFEADGSLRFFRSGISIHEYASIDLRNVKGIWSLKINEENENYLVVAFFDQTRFFHLENDEVEEIELSPFDEKNQTLCCANVDFDQIVQITTSSIRLIDKNAGKILTEWKNESGEITVGTLNRTQCLCAVGNQLFYFQIEQNSLREINRKTFSHNIACLDVTPFKSTETRNDFCVVGFWTQISLSILRFPNLEILHREILVEDALPRSAVMISFDDQPFLVVSLADGSIIYFSLNRENGFLHERRKIALGTKPTTLAVCQYAGSTSSSNSDRVLIACTDRPTVISSSNGKLIFTAINLREIVTICSLNSSFFGPSLTLVNENGLILGRIDDLQKLHVRSLPLAESVRRICLLEQEKSIFISTSTSNSTNKTDSIVPISQQAQRKIFSHDENQTNLSKNRNSLIVLDQQTHQVRFAVDFGDEEVTSLCAVKFVEDPSNSIIAVGSTTIFDDENQENTSRIVLFEEKNDQLTKISELQLDRIVHRLLPFHGGLLAAVGKKIQLFNFSLESRKLVELCQPFIGHVECLNLSVKDDFVAVSDLYCAPTILRYDSQEKKFEKIASNPHPVWALACAFIDDETILCSTDEAELFCCQKNSESTKENERKVLKRSAFWHLGETINVLKSGYLVAPQTTETNISLETCILMASISGYIGLTVQLPKSVAPLLVSLERSLLKNLSNIFPVEKEDFRTFFCSDDRSKTATAFVDGDLIERFLDLTKPVQLEIVKNLRGENETLLNTTVEELVKIIEDLSRLH